MNEITKTIPNLPAQQVRSLELCKGLLQAVEQGETIAVVRLEQKVTLDDAVQGISLKNVIMYTSEDLVISGLISLILRASAFFNIGRGMTEDQATETAFLLLEKYPHESLEDFVIMFRNAKLGKYGDGKLYNRLDGQIIFGWMAEYMEEKAAHREKLHQLTKSNSKKETQNLSKIILGNVNADEKPIIEALKQAIEFDPDEEKREASFREYRKNFIAKKITEKGPDSNKINFDKSSQKDGISEKNQ